MEVVDVRMDVEALELSLFVQPFSDFSTRKLPVSANWLLSLH